MGRIIMFEVGQRVGRGVVIEQRLRVPSEVEGRTRPAVRLRCNCGNEYVALPSQLVERNGRINTQSCGCARKDHIRRVAYRGGKKPVHGKTKHPLFNTWNLIRERCENPEFHKYPRYGGRGIELCDRWHDVSVFIEDIERELGPRPPKYTLDRIDNDGNYEPGNVQWASPRQQAQNRAKQGSSRYPGVHWIKSKRSWVARVHLGSFGTEEEAAAVYERAVAVLEREGILR